MADDSTDTLSDSSFSCCSSHFWGTQRAALTGRRQQPEQQRQSQRRRPRPPRTRQRRTVRHQHPRSARLKSCPGKIIANRTNSSSNGSVNLKVYYSAKNDRNCVVATRFGWPAKTQGRSDESDCDLATTTAPNGRNMRTPGASRTPLKSGVSTWTTPTIGASPPPPRSRAYTGMGRVTARASSMGCN